MKYTELFKGLLLILLVFCVFWLVVFVHVYSQKNSKVNKFKHHHERLAPHNVQQNEMQENTWNSERRQLSSLDICPVATGNSSNFLKHFSKHLSSGSTNKSTLFYCGVPKIGTTFTKKLISNIPKCQGTGLCNIKVPAITEIHTITEQTFSFMWTRDPYSRLFAAYENKLYHPSEHWDGNLEKDIVKVIRNTTSTATHNVTFSEFIKYVLVMAEKMNVRELDRHMRPIHLICDPCEIPFDFVGRLETFSESVQLVCEKLQTMGILSDSQTCNANVSIESLCGRAKRVFQYKNNQRHNLSRTMLRNVFVRSWSSYQIRGYISKVYSMPFNDNDLTSLTIGNYTDVLKTTIEVSRRDTGLKAQRREALVQAYMTIPIIDMQKLKEYVRTDCLLFGYDLEPDDLFQSRELYGPHFNYFKGLQVPDMHVSTSVSDK